MNIIFKYSKNLNRHQIEKLYIDAGWYAYTKDMDQLQQAMENSLEVVSAWVDNKLVGLVRAVGDGLTILYIQDILVLKSYQNHGIASQLMKRVLDKYKDVRQKVLLTEDAPDVRHFYEKIGFQSCDQGNLVSFAKFN